MPNIALRTSKPADVASGCPPEACQNGIFFVFHSADNSANGLRLWTSKSNKLPWLAYRALNFRVTPGPQVCGAFARAIAGAKSPPNTTARKEPKNRNARDALTNSGSLPRAHPVYVSFAPFRHRSTRICESARHSTFCRHHCVVLFRSGVPRMHLLARDVARKNPASF